MCLIIKIMIIQIWVQKNFYLTRTDKDLRIIREEARKAEKSSLQQKGLNPSHLFTGDLCSLPYKNIPCIESFHSI